MRLTTSISLVFSVGVAVSFVHLSAQTFTNPIFSNSADPSVVFVPNGAGVDGGNYYAVRSGCTGVPVGGAGICLKNASTIPGLTGANWVPIWIAPAAGPNSTNVWAPQIRYFPNESEHWYIYYSAVSNTAPADDHRLFALTPIGSSITTANSWQAASTGNPPGQMMPSWVNSSWAIDPDVFTAAYDGHYYLLFSCRQNNDEANTIHGWNQSICISAMSSPLAPTGSAVALSEPTQPWEIRDFPTEEGPFGVVQGSVDYILFSGSSSAHTDDYAVGMLSNNHPAQLGGGNPMLNPAAWVKQGPLFDGHNYAYGTASTVLTVSPDSSQVWNVYHGTYCLNPTGYNTGKCPTDISGINTWQDRSVRAQPAGWSATGQLVLGYPVDVVDADQSGSAAFPIPNPPDDGTHHASLSAIPSWGNAFGDAAEGDTTDGVASSVWSSPTANGIVNTSGTGINFIASFYYANPNWQNYTVFTNLQLGSTDNAAPHPKAGIYGAYVDRNNYYLAMIDPICGGTQSNPTPCVTTQVVIGGVSQNWFNCALSQLPSRQVFNPTGTNSLAVEAVNGVFNVLVNGIALTGACVDLTKTWSLNKGNQISTHGSNGQVGVIAQDMGVTYTNFTVSYGVPIAGVSGGLGPLFALQSLIAPNSYNLDNNGATSTNSPASLNYTTAKNAGSYLNANPPAPVSWTANSQLWMLRGETGESFEITNAANGLCLDLSGSNVVQNTCNSSTTTQNWWFIPVSTLGSFVIQNASTLQAIDANGVVLGGQLKATTRTGVTSQKWQLISQ